MVSSQSGVSDCAEARMFRHDHVVMFGKIGHERQPVGAAAGAMQEQQRAALAAAHQADVTAADGDFGGGGICHAQLF